MTDTVILWGHALAALLFCMVALAQARDAGEVLPRRTLVTALLATALWALAVAGIGPQDLAARVFESLRNLAWLAFMFAPARRTAPRALALAYCALAVTILVGTAVAVAEASFPAPEAAAIFRASRMGLRMMAAAAGLVLANQLFAGLREPRSGLRMIVGALGALWALDLLIYGLAYFASFDPLGLIAVRGAVTVLLAPLFAVAIHRRGDWTLRVSRAVAWQSIALAGAAFYLLVMVLACQAITLVVGEEHQRVAQTALIFGGTAALITVVSSPWLRAWAKVMLAKHLFRHRYDYRAEWLRFTDTLGKPDNPAPLAERVVQATADLTDSPAGLLLVPHEQGMHVAARWNWPVQAEAGAGRELADWLAASGRIVEMDGLRSAASGPAEAAAVPQWMLDGEGWALVPLMHFERLQGAILLARPPVPRALDWEDLDLLRLAGRQVASYLAEANAQEALGEAQRFDEFNRRFAFILHDIKNLVSQLSLLARNAERHADNPEFRADMIATLQESAGRMNDLLARLSQHHRSRAEPPVVVELSALAERVAARLRVTHPVVVTVETPAAALADPARLEQAVAQLALNAVQASAPAEPVTILVGVADGRATLDVIDAGCGMSLGFVRDKLFKPFLSTKPAGFGIGAFEARQLVIAMGGSIAVDSREGEGTRFRLSLPLAQPGAEPATASLSRAA
ncbi:XrtA/PEP-CTERM system histidine kinase PrsK [Sphingomonas aracearum]|uniref:histidine kinase n=1 Tax=Sphingomonas aracearum TaxID=2283317 RepID=A0A369VVX8_9SPHN|nr:XrtA/PEP-CTERM system histidine kinase PrsK [Sphingomonas aracearum]RDE05999.1 PEP-CTERM system histidine kinase PrsK [Sphingomonas aracearum]